MPSFQMRMKVAPNNICCPALGSCKAQQEPEVFGLQERQEHRRVSCNKYLPVVRRLQCFEN
ncbi:MAG: hypothetical protein ACK40X_14000, partial [Armatimonadota bacterium]